MSRSSGSWEGLHITAKWELVPRPSSALMGESETGRSSLAFSSWLTYLGACLVMSRSGQSLGAV